LLNLIKITALINYNILITGHKGFIGNSLLLKLDKMGFTQDKILLFEKEDIDKIVEIELAKLTKRVEKLGFKITLTKAAKVFIGDKGYDKKYGARPLNRAIQKYIEDLLAESVVNNKIEDDDEIIIDHSKGKEKLQIQHSEEK